MRFTILSIAVIAALAVSCNNNSSDHDTTKSASAPVATPPPAKPSSSLSEKGTGDLMSLLAAYYELKDAMVATDTSIANAAASRVLSAGETMRNTLNEDTAHTALLPNVEVVMKQSEAITSDKQNNIELKRASFEKVSDALYALLKDAKLEHAKVYHQYCPMAFNDKGAYWLSSEEEIKNPYFGKKMLECGEVKDSL